MNDNTGSYPSDEPVIGGNYPGTVVADGGEAYDDGFEDGAEYEDDYDDAAYNDDGYYDSGPGRQPLFYAFIGVAAIVGAIVVYLLYSFLNQDDSVPTAGTPDVQFRVRLDTPLNDDRVEIGKEKIVQVTASSNEAITKFQLFVNDKPDEEVTVTEVPPDRIYTGRLKFVAAKRGDYTLFVRVTSASKASRDSTKVRVIAFEPFSEQAPFAKGKVQTTTSARRQPRDDGEEVRRLNPGEDVRIVARSKDSDWLMIEGVNSADSLWVKAAAIQVLDPIGDLPVRDAVPSTPSPVSTATTAAQPSPSATSSTTTTPSPSPISATVDFAPTGASLIENGRKLRVTITNAGTSPYNGSLVVSVAGVGATQKTVFSVNAAANGQITVEFPLSDTVTSQVSAQIRVDPDNAIRETNEDNNTATFTLIPPVEPPQLTITQAAVQGVEIAVTITNTGGELKPVDLTVRLTFPGGSGTASLSQNQTVALAKGQSAVVRLTKPNVSGPASVQVFQGGAPQTPPFPFNLP